MIRRLKQLLFASDRPARPLFDAVVAAARQPEWYRGGGVPDTAEGRFACLATLLALTILRLERGGAAARHAASGLTECFVDEMDGEVREMGVSDPGVPRQVGAMVGALGSRVGRFRAVLAGDQGWEAAVRHGLHRGAPVDAAAAEQACALLAGFGDRLERAGDAELIEGRLA